MGIDPADAADIEWLVLKHLRMAAIAQRRDLSDPDLIHAFAEEVRDARPAGEALPPDLRGHRHGRPAHLDRLEGAAPARALPEDARGAAPRASAGRSPGTAEAAGRELAVEALQQRARGVRVEDQRPLPRGDAGPLLPHRRARGSRRATCGSCRSAAAAASRPSTRHRPDLGHSELALTAPDRPGLLATIAGVLAAHRIDIQHAEVFSTPRRRRRSAGSPAAPSTCSSCAARRRGRSSRHAGARRARTSRASSPARSRSTP